MLIWYILAGIIVIICIFLFYFIGIFSSIDIDTIVSIIMIILVLVLPFLFISGALWIICWAFDFSWWSWKICLGVYIIYIILKSIFKKEN